VVMVVVVAGVFTPVAAVSHIEFTRAQFSHRIVPGRLSSSLQVLVAFTFARD
jgi:hypothetical protein